MVVKAQVQVGGRGKAGGIKVAKDHQELEEHIDAILGMDIKGHKVESLLIEEASEIISEYYISGVPDSGWIHVSYKKSGNRKQSLIKNKGEGYIEWR